MHPTPDEGHPAALERLWDTIVARRDQRPSDSYVVKLLDAGPVGAGAKVLEEAAELVEAADHDDPAHTVYEAADLLFHTFVLMASAGIEPSQVYAELDRRTGTSGLTEKANRSSQTAGEDR